MLPSSLMFNTAEQFIDSNIASDKNNSKINCLNGKTVTITTVTIFRFINTHQLMGGEGELSHR